MLYTLQGRYDRFPRFIYYTGPIVKDIGTISDGVVPEEIPPPLKANQVGLFYIGFMS